MVGSVKTQDALSVPAGLEERGAREDPVPDAALRPRLETMLGGRGH